MKPENKLQKTDHDRVLEILRIEAEAINCAAAALEPSSVDDAIRILLSATGKVVLIGVGKSGVIAQKIAQTMTSTGTMAVFVHPSDALHGGLGVVAENDVVVALSNSGETEELLALLPALKSRGLPMISIVGDCDSTLGRQSDVAIMAGVDREACPLNLAPTASTTVALAIGDALAMAIMERKGLTAEDFALNHPAGRLGKRLTIKVKDIMHASPNVIRGDGWLEVVHRISGSALGAVNVVDENSCLLGIITDGDLRRTIEKTPPDGFGFVSAGTMMTPTPISVGPEMLAYEALRIMEERESQIAVLPVVDPAGVCLGLLRLHDIVRAGL